MLCSVSCLSVWLLVTNTKTVAELEETGVPVVTPDRHQTALLVDLGAVESLV